MTPRKFIAVILLSLLVLVVLVVLSLSQQRNAPPKVDQEPSQEQRLLVTQEALEKVQQLGEQDTDGDGLLDWEESLWGTDPMLVDSNDDGISDYDEVMEVKGQIDERDQQQGANEPQELGPIDTISRDLYSTVALLEQQGELNDHTEGQVVGLFQETILQSFQYEPVGLPALALVADSAKTRAEYFIALDTLLRQYMLAEEDFVFVANSSQAPIKSDASLAVVEKYQMLAISMIELPTPVGLQGQHLAVVNAVGQLATALEGLLYADIDPLTGLSSGVIVPVAVGEYHTALVNLYAADGQDITAQ